MREKLMTKSTFIIVCSIAALLNLLVFWIPVAQNTYSVIIPVFSVTGVIFLGLIKRRVNDPGADERRTGIGQMAAFHTPEVFRLVFFVICQGSTVRGFGRPGSPEGKPGIVGYTGLRGDPAHEGIPVYRKRGGRPAFAALPYALPLCRVPVLVCGRTRGMGF
ncbi:MAG: DUF2178 domain-containing protein [Methanoregulaceae archaeon]